MQIKTSQVLSSRKAIFLVAAMMLALSGCGKPAVELTTAKMIESLDKGSGNFDRVLQVCFSEPISATYFHKIVIVTEENVKITGQGSLRPLASDPDNKCHLRNVYSYIHKDSPIEARQLIKDYVVSGNVSQVLIQVYNEKPSRGDKPIAEKLFKNL